jgi:hypothetical protein
MTEPTNVIRFPTRDNIDAAQVSSIEEAVEKAENAKAYYCEMIVDDLMGVLLAKCQMAGYAVLEDDEGIRDSIMVAEAITSMLYRTQKIDHFVQKLVDAAIDLDEMEAGKSDFTFDPSSISALNEDEDED